MKKRLQQEYAQFGGGIMVGRNLYFKDGYYDDLQGAASTARVPAVNAPTWRTFDYNIVGGIAFAVLGFAVGDYQEISVQTNHGMTLNSVLENHIHWTIPSDSIGDKFQFQVDIIAAAKDVAFAVPAGSPFAAEETLVGGESGKHNYFDLADIPAVNTTVSTIYKVRLTRIAASVSEYAGEIYIEFNDNHFKGDTVGSLTEDEKFT